MTDIHKSRADSIGAGGSGTEIEITPEMIEAGVDVVRSYETFFSLSPSLEELLVEKVLKAALERAAQHASGAHQEIAPS